jgi:hypothetical protein
MKSNKQKRAELDARKTDKRDARMRAEASAQIEKRRAETAYALAHGDVACNPENLAPNNSYDTPHFVARGRYSPVAFSCESCGKDEVWTPHQQKWWYEVAKGGVFTTAKFCRPCRRREQDRKAAARKASLEGLARKATARKAAAKE